MTRLLTLLLLTRVTAEWVEISQHHYRKPLRTHSTFTTTEKSKDVEDSTKPWAYSNRTLTEYNWNENPARPIIGNVKRIQHIANTVRATDVVKLEDEDADFDADEIEYEVKLNYGPTRATLDTHDRVKQKDIIETDENIVSKQNTKLTESTTETTPKNNVHRNVNNFETESFASKVHDAGNKDKQSNVKVEDQDMKPNFNNVQLKDVLDKDEKKSEKIKYVTDKEGEPTNGTKNEKMKINTMENLIKFMRVVADTISKNSRRSFGGKMQYLHELKDSILANIEQRIDATWPDDDSANSRRRSRSAQASPRGHVQFPSSESALMTISFLTFAVFLIKLVLQVIQTYKQKAMMVAPLMVASGRHVFANHGHH
ncbi:hypothetical protein B5X24_HaOG204106 [Helicoverpa armigera]|uniref:Uncharacterized protein n=1 Tax=Helicoverpa armigera TaxID=29058 RepID=A0A2W1BP02_HELAM|nr:hypothetical protein B5X24_HaOG204106 [Helicoverpa armigera]